jgi:hypothetical protein
MALIRPSTAHFAFEEEGNAAVQTRENRCAAGPVNRALQAHTFRNTDLLQEEQYRAEHFGASVWGFQVCTTSLVNVT